MAKEISPPKPFARSTAIRRSSSPDITQDLSIHYPILPRPSEPGTTTSRKRDLFHDASESPPSTKEAEQRGSTRDNKPRPIPDIDLEPEPEMISLRPRTRTGPGSRKSTFAKCVATQDTSYTFDQFKLDVIEDPKSIFLTSLDLMQQQIESQRILHQKELEFQEAQQEIYEYQLLKEKAETELHQLQDYVTRKELTNRIHDDLRGSPISSDNKGSGRPGKIVKLPDPPMFSGSLSNELDFDTWYSRICNKLEGNKDHFLNNPTMEKAYVISRLSGLAAKQCSTRAHPLHSNPYKSADEVLNHLREIYEDPNKVENTR